MSAPLPARNIVVLTTALLAGGLFAIHGLVTPPWVYLFEDGPVAAAAVWLLAPCLMAGAAVVVGGVGLGDRRNYPWAPMGCRLVAALVVVAAVGALAVVGGPSVSRLDGAALELAPLAAVVGLGMALAAAFWQGLVQLRLGDNWPPAARAVMVTVLATVVWVPFWINSPDVADGSTALVELAVVALAGAILSELGMNLGGLMAAVAAMAGAAVYLHPAPWG